MNIAEATAAARIHHQWLPEEIRIEEERREAFAGRLASMVRAEGGNPSSLSPPPIDPMKRHFYNYALQFDSSERLWVLTGRGDSDTSVFDVFDADRQYLGELTVEAHIDRYRITGDWLVSKGAGELDHPVVQLWRIR